GSSTYDIDFPALKQNLEARFGGQWKILYRGHYYLENDSNIPDYVINVSSHDDMQEVLLVADVLVTDYSSSVWDFGLLERPCFLYTPDKVEYEAVTNYCTPLEEWPYPFALTNEALGLLIKEYDKETYLERLHAHQERLGTFEKGQACPIVADFIANIIK
ncbi:MAG: CDP-glycerol glycerophosphotransferase family protein, partial [Veillonella sp.]